MLRYRCQLRRWSAQILVLWLFGIASSFANTCLGGNLAGLSAQAGAGPQAVHAPDPLKDSTASDAPHPSAGANEHCGAGHGPASLKTNCEDFCDKSTISIPPLKLAIDHADASAAQSPVAVHFATATSEPAHRRLSRLDGDLAPPCAIAIAFLRLAL